MAKVVLLSVLTPPEQKRVFAFFGGLVSVAVVKIVELIGASSKSWEDAVHSALKRAGKTIKGITGVEVLGWNAVVRNARIAEYRANIKIAFEVKE